MNNKEYRLDRYDNNEEFREKAKEAAKKWRRKNPNYLKEYYLANKEKFKKKDSVKKRLERSEKNGNKYDELLKLAQSKGFKNVAEFIFNND